MTILFRIILSAILAIISSLMLQLASGGDIASTSPLSVIIVFVACLSTALISPAIGQSSTSSQPKKTASASSGSSYKSNDNASTASSANYDDKDREQGLVKWFNVSKGYGFVTRQSGEDIFVHFRSIRGTGRRMLREGQTVEFVVVEGDKGPQAEDVEAL